MANHPIISHRVQPGLKPLPQVKNIIVVGSGKGGVGKSTTAVNLALALQQDSARVGLLDADIHGPNQPQMLGVTEKPEITAEKRFKPIERYGLQTMSIGYLMNQNTPMVWRGPMVSKALEQLCFDTDWHNLDYLIIDLPPGTGDIQLTLAQKIPVSGAVIVTTPQPVALLDARKGLEMFRKVSVAVLGIVENMSYYVCPCCNHQETIFGEEGASQLAQATNSVLLGKLPLDKRIREQADQGKPIVIAQPESMLAQVYREVAQAVAAQLALQPKDYAGKMPNVIIES